MADLISRRALEEILQDTMQRIVIDNEWLQGYVVGLKAAFQLIINAPTIEAEPIRHGQWIEAEDGDGVVCSECGTDFCTLIYSREDLKYCICGAKMDGGTEDGTDDLISNKYTMELVWHSCTSCLPKEDYNPCLYVTNGKEVFPVAWRRTPEWQRFISDNWYIEPGVNSDGIWWADLAQTVKGFEPLQHLT